MVNLMACIASSSTQVLAHTQGQKERKKEGKKKHSVSGYGERIYHKGSCEEGKKKKKKKGKEETKFVVRPCMAVAPWSQELPFSQKETP